jgi:hypothetical protein
MRITGALDETISRQQLSAELQIVQSKQNCCMCLRKTGRKMESPEEEKFTQTIQ